MDGFTAVLPMKFFILIINTYHSFARARERKRKTPACCFSFSFAFFSRLFKTQDEGRELQKKEAAARVFIFRKSERDTHSFSRYTHTHRKA